MGETAPAFQRLFYSIKDRISESRYRRQRVKRGYSDYDVLDMQMWFIRTLKPMLENVRANLFSCPDELTLEEWEAILDEMIDCLTLMGTETHIGVYDDGSGGDLFLEDRQGIYDIRYKEAPARFFELFGKWFWDITY